MNELQQKRDLYLRTKYQYIMYKNAMLLDGGGLFSNYGEKRINMMKTGVFDKTAYGKNQGYCNRIFYNNTKDIKVTNLIYGTFTNEFIAKASDHDVVYNVSTLERDLKPETQTDATSESNIIKLYVLAIAWNANGNIKESDEYMKILDNNFYKKVTEQVARKFFKLLTGKNIEDNGKNIEDNEIYKKIIEVREIYSIEKINKKYSDIKPDVEQDMITQKMRERISEKDREIKESLRRIIDETKNILNMTAENNAELKAKNCGKNDEICKKIKAIYDDTEKNLGKPEHKDEIDADKEITKYSGSILDLYDGRTFLRESIKSLFSGKKMKNIIYYAKLYLAIEQYINFDIITINVQNSNVEVSNAMFNGLKFKNIKTDCDKNNMQLCTFVNTKNIEIKQYRALNNIPSVVAITDVTNFGEIKSVVGGVGMAQHFSKSSCYGVSLYITIKLLNFNINICGYYLPEKYIKSKSSNKTRKYLESLEQIQKDLKFILSKLNEINGVIPHVNILTGDIETYPHNKNDGSFTKLLKNDETYKNIELDEQNINFHPTCWLNKAK